MADIQNVALDKLWGKESLELNWTAVPNSLIFLQHELGITSQELVVLLNILMHRFSSKPERLPFPSVGSIATRTGQTQRNVRRHLTSLEKKGMLKRVSTPREGTYRGRNQYDVAPLIQELKERTPKLKANLKSPQRTSK